MKLKDILTKDEVLELRKRTPKDGVMKVPYSIYRKIQKASKSIKLELRYEPE